MTSIVTWFYFRWST